MKNDVYQGVRHCRFTRQYGVGLIILLLVASSCTHTVAQSDVQGWPEVSRQMRPWAYWWWMGSAVDKDNITSQLQEYQKAGMGGVHIIPIYGAKGYEDRYIEYLSPQWMEMLDYTVTEADRLGMGVDMTLGTGWCFGGPMIPDTLANASVKYKVEKVTGPADVQHKVNPAVQTLMAYGPNGQILELTDKIANGEVKWTAPEGDWQIYELWQQPSGRMVKRAAPGGQGHMLNPFSREATETFLKEFDKAFRDYKGRMPRAIYHDSYEYVCNWSPDLLSEFQKRRGYRLQDYLPALLDKNADPQLALRVKADYRWTISEMMMDNFTQTWVQWAKSKGCLTRNEAHGSPANLLDLYAASDSPETEFFRFDRNPLIAKFSSSAAHTAGRQFTSCETGTWLQEHFQVTLGHLKPFIDGLFVSGVNHVFYHGTCYSPKEAPWPGWVFYASTQMNPRNSIWKDVLALNTYLARCQSVLQAGKPDQDILLYWPICDLWSDANGMNQDLGVHDKGWLRNQPIGTVASTLWKKGYAFDYVSDRQLSQAKAGSSGVSLPGGTYRAIIVPPVSYIPLQTLQTLYRLAEEGASVLFVEKLPSDVFGLSDLEKQRETMQKLLNLITWDASAKSGQTAPVGKGRFLVDANPDAMLQAARVRRESMVDHPGIVYIRRADDAGTWYFIANHDEQFIHNPATPYLNGWVKLAVSAESVVMMDPMTGKSGLAASRKATDGQTEVYLQLEPGQSIILRALKSAAALIAKWDYYQTAGQPIALEGLWKVRFTDGGPERPASFETQSLASWTVLGDDNARRFAGTARYSLVFDKPDIESEAWTLDLGHVADSAVVFLNGQNLGTAFTTPFQIRIASSQLKASGNLLEIDVTNVAANRIRDMDINKVLWKNFHDTNFVNIDYKPFDASNWPIRDAGLLGPVQLIPQARIQLDKSGPEQVNTLPTLWIIGDSTVKNNTRGLQGWGDPIAAYFDATKINVKNRALGGRSSRTFQTEGLWDKVLSEMKSGDFVLIQFGHNDNGPLNTGRARASLHNNSDDTQEVVMESTGKTEIVHSYGWYLRKYIADAKAKGATPIILSLVPRNMWSEDGKTVNRATSDYTLWASQAARQGGVDFVDLNNIIADHYEVLGQDKVKTELFLEDHTHTTSAGAKLNAESVVEGLRRLAQCKLCDYLL
ncbi:MAG: glycosyl hydrolase [Anaerohalosphaeraceae bacterium]